MADIYSDVYSDVYSDFYGSVNPGTVYGQSNYGASTYGYIVAPDFRVDPFTAKSIDYQTILVSWTKPQGTILAWRLVKNMFGYPADQDDGEILIDTTAGYPGNYFIDNNIVPGRFHYYAFYVLLSFGENRWLRSGVTGTLAIRNYESGLEIHSLMPSFFHLRGGLEVSSMDDFPSEILDFFCLVLGWGFDLLRTQYDTYLNVNDPWKIPLSDLYNLAVQLGLDINPDIHPYTLRKAIFNNAVINKQKGTPAGIAAELSSLTGYNADLQIGRNIMLSNDQSQFTDPVFLPWSNSIAYNIGENVQFGNFWYQCIASGNRGNSPTGLNTSNTWWSPITGVNTTAYLTNAATTFQSTWELINTSNTNGVPGANTLFETLGVANPVNTSSFTFNSLQGINTSGSAGTLWLRSISRVAADIGVTANFSVDKYQAMADGIPLAYSLPSQAWNPSVRYETGQIVTFNTQPYIALRASTGITPPYLTPGAANSEWAPLSFDQRYRICVSGYVTGSSGSESVFPFIEMYDAQGNFIGRLISRNQTPGSVTFPNQFAYDSFVVGSGSTLGGRLTDDGQFTWNANINSFTVSPFNNGCVFPSNQNSTRTVATLSSASADCQVAITFVTNPRPGQSEGLVFRWTNGSNYFRADQTTLWVKQSGTFTSLGTYSTPFYPGDRMIAKLNGSTITILRNGVQVLQVTSTFNQSSATHGIIVENT